MLPLEWSFRRASKYDKAIAAYLLVKLGLVLAALSAPGSPIRSYTRALLRVDKHLTDSKPRVIYDYRLHNILFEFLLLHGDQRFHCRAFVSAPFIGDVTRVSPSLIFLPLRPLGGAGTTGEVTGEVIPLDFFFLIT